MITIETLLNIVTYVFFETHEEQEQRMGIIRQTKGIIAWNIFLNKPK